MQTKRFFCKNRTDSRENSFRLRACAFLLALTLVLLTLSSSGCAQKNAFGRKDGLPVILVGCETYPPYSYEDTSGRPTGLDIDLANEAFRRIGYRAEFVYIEWENKKQLVESGQIDCIWNCFSINGREDQYSWTEPYMYSHQVVAVRQDSDIYALSDLAGKRIAVQSTTIPEEIFLTHTDPRIPQVEEVFSLHNRELLYPYLSKGYADAVAAHETSILQCMSDYNLEYRILDEPLLTAGLGAAFSKSDNRGLEKELSEVFAEMRQDGTLREIIGRYFSDPDRFLEDVPYEE